MSFKKGDKVIINGPVDLRIGTVIIHAAGLEVVEVGEKRSIINFEAVNNKKPLLIPVDNEYIEKLNIRSE